MSNRLAAEKSPYLLQHANNPVDWFPWSDEAFARATREDKPIFLSIGYSTCHWCHVMEKESFEDVEVASLLNEVFVCIKVDREERPDIDSIYMTVCSMMTGGGGWPLTIVMTPDRKPFFSGTYFAKHSHYGRMGLLDLIPRLQDIWRNRRHEVLQSADRILEILQQQNQSLAGSEPGLEILHRTFAEVSRSYDSRSGGFSTAPKFPTPHKISFLLRYWLMTGEMKALAMVEQTLTAMRLGGIFDHVGFGFHRYSTDALWLLPHFEKMLYDQALLAIAYLEGYQATGNHLFKQTAAEIFTYVLRDLTAPEGGFYSAEDADSEGIEGRFYLWRLEEIQTLLSPEDAEFIQAIYHLQAGGNFHDEATGSRTGLNILHLASPRPENLPVQMQDREQLLKRYENIRRRLFDHRAKRVPPHKDDKILTDWNGLMIAAFALGARILDDERYLAAATEAVQFLTARMLQGDRLLHRYRNGEAAVAGMLCDYAYVVRGLLELYTVNFDPDILEQALLLNERMLQLFWDDTAGGLFLTAADGEALPVRPKELYDGAVPSGNSVALDNLLRLERLTGNHELGARARQLTQAFSGSLQEAPSAYTQFMASLSSAFTPATEVVIVGDSGADDTLQMLGVLRQSFLPHTVTLLKDTRTDTQKLVHLAPFTADLTAIGNRATAYVCRNFSCESPVTDAEELSALLQGQKVMRKG